VHLASGAYACAVRHRGVLICQLQARIGAVLVRKHEGSRLDSAGQEPDQLLFGNRRTGLAMVLPSSWTAPATATLSTGPLPRWLFKPFVLVAFLATHIGLIHLHDPAQKFRLALLEHLAQPVVHMATLISG